jgi:hypothetical protein
MKRTEAPSPMLKLHGTLLELQPAIPTPGITLEPAAITLQDLRDPTMDAGRPVLANRVIVTLAMLRAIEVAPPIPRAGVAVPPPGEAGVVVMLPLNPFLVPLVGPVNRALVLLRRSCACCGSCRCSGRPRWEACARDLWHPNYVDSWSPTNENDACNACRLLSFVYLSCIFASCHRNCLSQPEGN